MLARAREEIGDVGVEPDIVAAHRPQAERAVGVLARHEPRDGILQTLVDVAGHRHLRFVAKILHIQHGHGHAGGLLGAGERIAVERIEQARGIERGRDRDRERHASGAGREVGKHVAVERQRLAGGKRPHTAADKRLRRRPHIKRIGAIEGKAVRPAHAHVDGAGARARSRHRQRDMAALLGVERERLLAALDLGRALHAHRYGVVAGRALDIVELELHCAVIAGAQEARQRRGQHHRIAHHHVAGGLAESVLAPGHRHHAHGAGEGRNIEAHLRAAVGCHFDDAGIERERRLRRRRAGQFGAARRRRSGFAPARPACRRSAAHRDRGCRRSAGAGRDNTRRAPAACNW